MVNGRYHSIPNDQVIAELAERVGLQTSYKVERALQKTSAGNIRTETVLFLVRN
jgi:hypothetical protein